MRHQIPQSSNEPQSPHKCSFRATQYSSLPSISDFGFKQSKSTKSSFPIKTPNRSHSISTKQNSFFEHRHSFKSTRRDHSTAFAISLSQLHTHQISRPSKSRKVVLCTLTSKVTFSPNSKSKPTRAQQHHQTPADKPRSASSQTNIKVQHSESEVTNTIDGSLS